LKTRWGTNRAIRGAFTNARSLIEHSSLLTAARTMAASYRTGTRLPRPMPRRLRYRALLDFDGTIAPDDPTDRLLDQFADPEWRVIEAAWQGERLTSRECMQRQVALLRATPRQLDAAIRDIEIDPGFSRFVSFCHSRGVDLAIVSDGFDRVVRTVLRRARLPIRFFANTLQWQGGDRWRLAMPHSRRDCRTDAANCKCAHGTWDDGLSIVIGDGRSDFCMSVRAGYVIAKGALADFCRARRLPHAPFRDFDDATLSLAEWLDLRGDWPGQRKRPAGAGTGVDSASLQTLADDVEDPTADEPREQRRES
jgi:2,3-diketo-5-methylthio-1-phosphopentane phosphatase